MTPRQRIGEGTYRDGFALAARLAVRIRELVASADGTADSARAAIDANAAAQAVLSEHVLLYRQLCAALTASAGQSKPVSLSDTVEAVAQLLD